MRTLQTLYNQIPLMQTGQFFFAPPVYFIRVYCCNWA